MTIAQNGREGEIEMASYSRSRNTSAKPETVWRLWSDPKTWPEWNPDVASMSVPGPVQPGGTGEMRTKAGRTHEMRVLEVQPGRWFSLETHPMPLSTFVFRCEVEPAAAGSRITQSVATSGPLGSLIGALGGQRIADGFGPILDGLAHKAEQPSSGGNRPEAPITES